MADFNLVAAKAGHQILIPRQIFQLYGVMQYFQWGLKY